VYLGLRFKSYFYNILKSKQIMIRNSAVSFNFGHAFLVYRYVKIVLKINYFPLISGIYNDRNKAYVFERCSTHH